MLVTERERLREELVALADKYGRQRSSLMAILQETQRRQSRISEYAMQVIADLLDIHPVEVYSVVSFLQLSRRAAARAIRDPLVPHDHLRHGRQVAHRPTA